MSTYKTNKKPDRSQAVDRIWHALQQIRRGDIQFPGDEKSSQDGRKVVKMETSIRISWECVHDKGLVSAKVDSLLP